MSAREGLTVTHRRYVPASHAHYGGNLVDGAYVLGLFGDVATEVCIRTDRRLTTGTGGCPGRDLWHSLSLDCSSTLKVPFS